MGLVRRLLPPWRPAFLKVTLSVMPAWSGVFWSVRLRQRVPCQNARSGLDCRPLGWLYLVSLVIALRSNSLLIKCYLSKASVGVCWSSIVKFMLACGKHTEIKPLALALQRSLVTLWPLWHVGVWSTCSWLDGLMLVTLSKIEVLLSATLLLCKALLLSNFFACTVISCN